MASLSLQAFAYVALGGALGACARYAVALLAGHWLGLQFPFGTLLVNIAGSLAMGLLIGAAASGWQISQEARLFVAVGLLGAFTTFSTFSLDVATLYRRGELGLTALYLALSVVLSIGALFAGLALARRLLAS